MNEASLSPSDDVPSKIPPIETASTEGDVSTNQPINESDVALENGDSATPTAALANGKLTTDVTFLFNLEKISYLRHNLIF